MPKKKEPTGTPVKAGTTKTATKEPAKVTPAVPVKSEEAAKPTVAQAAAKPAAKATATAKAAPAANPVEAAEKPAAATATPAKAAEKPAAAAPAPAKAAEKPAAAAASPAKAAEKPAATPAKAEKSTTSAKGKAAKAAVETKVPVSGKRADSVVTVIVAKYDAGFGNNLYIRGEGAGLSWDAGALMKNVENDVWVWTTNEMTEGVISFKFLLNDNTETWSAGDNLSASAGETTTITPSF